MINGTFNFHRAMISSVLQSKQCERKKLEMAESKVEGN